MGGGGRWGHKARDGVRLWQSWGYAGYCWKHWKHALVGGKQKLQLGNGGVLASPLQVPLHVIPGTGHEQAKGEVRKQAWGEGVAA